MKLAFNTLKTVFYKGFYLVLLHGVFSLLFVLFYTSNMRANLIRPAYEKPMRSFADINEKGWMIWLPEL